jgi:hypothetical protein
MQRRDIIYDMRKTIMPQIEYNKEGLMEYLNQNLIDLIKNKMILIQVLGSIQIRKKININKNVQKLLIWLTK